jgi:tRNA U38,U39,U40 pseudouridine synthase TruA
MKSVILSTYNDHLIFEFKSKSFLRQQIRRTVKKLMELGKNEISYDDFLELFDDTKEISYQPADPNGLILWDIKYDKKVTLKEDLKSKERMYNYFMEKELNYGVKHQLFRILQRDNFC